jgi:hypothetical protein
MVLPVFVETNDECFLGSKQSLNPCSRLQEQNQIVVVRDCNLNQKWRRCAKESALFLASLARWPCFGVYNHGPAPDNSYIKLSPFQYCMIEHKGERHWSLVTAKAWPLVLISEPPSYVHFSCCFFRQIVRHFNSSPILLFFFLSVVLLFGLLLATSLCGYSGSWAELKGELGGTWPTLRFGKKTEVPWRAEIREPGNSAAQAGNPQARSAQHCKLHRGIEPPVATTVCGKFRELGF